jgi:hypothetical protein
MDSMKIAYVIGPYRSKSVFGITVNICNARRTAAHLWQSGFAVICPHTNSACMDGLVPDEVFLSGDIEILTRCDFAVTVDGWEDSAGSRNEVDHCREYGIPIYHSVADAIGERIMNVEPSLLDY